MDLYRLNGYKFTRTNVRYGDIRGNEAAAGLIVCHLSYNLKQKDSLVIYRDILGSRNKLLTIDTADAQHYTVVTPKLKGLKKRFETIGSSPYMLVLCYDDAAILEECTFTVCDEKIYGAFREKEVAGYVPPLLLIEKQPFEEFKAMYALLPTIVRDAFSSRTGKVNAIVAALRKYLEEDEETYLRMYLSRMPDEEIAAIGYVKDYFYADFEMNVGEFV
jgi:hypothetical protein